MSLSVNANNYHAYGSQEPKKNTAKKVAVAAGAAAAIGTGIYLAKSGKGAEIAAKLKKNLESYAIGKKILGVADKISTAVNGIKEKIVTKAGELKITEKAENVKTAVKESPVLKKAAEIKTKVNEKVKNLNIKENILSLAEKFKGLFNKAA